jgi:transposase-like protein
VGQLNQQTESYFYIYISFERTILVAEKFIKDLIKKYEKHPLLSTDMVELGICKLADS